MVAIISQVKPIVKKNISHIELVRRAMENKKWKPADLSRVSGVSTGVLSRYFNPTRKKGSGISADNFFAILTSLDLVDIGYRDRILAIESKLESLTQVLEPHRRKTDIL